MINIIEYDKVYDESIKDLLVELQEHLIEIDDWNTQVMNENYREENFNIDMRKVDEQDGKIYLAMQDNKVIGLVIGIVDEKEMYFESIGCKRINIEVFGPNKKAYEFYSKNGYTDRDYIVSKRLD